MIEEQCVRIAKYKNNAFKQCKVANLYPQSNLSSQCQNDIYFG
jgi:hypothetical protein